MTFFRFDYEIWPIVFSRRIVQKKEPFNFSVSMIDYRPFDFRTTYQYTRLHDLRESTRMKRLLNELNPPQPIDNVPEGIAYFHTKEACVNVWIRVTKKCENKYSGTLIKIRSAFVNSRNNGNTEHRVSLGLIYYPFSANFCIRRKGNFFLIFHYWYLDRVINLTHSS